MIGFSREEEEYSFLKKFFFTLFSCSRRKIHIGGALLLYHFKKFRLALFIIIFYFF